QGKSPILRLAGRGDIDVGQDAIDYTVKASVTEAAAGLAGKELAQIVGVPVPVRVTGSLENPKYTVDIEALAVAVAKGAVEREVQRAIGGGKPGQPGSAGDAIGDALRGLFGKPK
ncbi:MAG TPA: AsmA family protein, partial [Candidatus Methylomirabilis sp.]|nr:AsmA family protein [Candidatus Methylomirabilis sp.]